MNIREALSAVYETHGSLTTDLVIAEAKANRSEAGKSLHDRLEWDDTVAGEQFRHVQAAALIRSVKVVYAEATEMEAARSVRGFHVIRGPQGNVYEPLERVANDEFTSQLLLREMQREWRAMHRRWAHFEEFIRMIREDLDAA